MHAPDLILADEPFTGLDAPSVDTLERCLADLHVQGRTVVLANHDIAQSLRLAQRALVLRLGRIALDQPTRELDSRIVLDHALGALRPEVAR
jgi:energy-coupling factor transporter ATP-binding protein EcfA2